MESEGYWKSCAKCAKHLDEILEDNEDIIEEYIHVWNKESVLWPGMKLSSTFVSSSDKCNECEKQAIRGGYLGEHERAEHEARSWGPGTDCAILMRRIRFVHFFSLIWVLWYTFSGVEMLVWSWKEVRCLELWTCRNCDEVIIQSYEVICTEATHGGYLDCRCCGWMRQYWNCLWSALR